MVNSHDCQGTHRDFFEDISVPIYKLSYLKKELNGYFPGMVRDYFLTGNSESKEMER